MLKGNISYSPEQGAKLFDLGDSSSIDECPKMGGTSLYMSPEYLVGRRDWKSDVWSLAVVMLYCLGVMDSGTSLEHWMLRDMAKPETIQKFKSNLAIIREKRRDLLRQGAEPALHRVVYNMLNESADRRLSATDVLRILQTDNLVVD